MVYRLGDRFKLKDIKLCRKDLSANKEAVAAFLAEMNKLPEETTYHPKQVFSCDETRHF
jgi:hypothetical protein